MTAGDASDETLFRDPPPGGKFTAAIALFALLAPGALVTPAFADNKEKDPDEIGNRDVGKGVNFYSIEKEIALGKQMAQEVERQAKIVDDPIIAEYVNRIGQNLVRNSDAKVPFTIKVIDSEEINAFALPGGFFFVNTGILLNADNEAEMAGVMAHEIAHVAARHGTRQATRGELAQIGSIVPLIAVGGMAGYGIYQAMGLAIPMGFLKFSRNFESEADMLGIEYMYKAGYDPTAFVDFFEKVQSQEKRKPGTMSKLFSSHPPTDDRIKHSQEIIQKYLKAEAGIRGQHERIRRREGAHAGDAQPPQDRQREGCGPADAAPQPERPDRCQRQRYGPAARSGRSPDAETPRRQLIDLTAFI